MPSSGQTVYGSISQPSCFQGEFFRDKTRLIAIIARLPISLNCSVSYEELEKVFIKEHVERYF